MEATQTDRTDTAPRVDGIEVGERLARGGTSEVWAGVRVVDAHPVVVKVLRAEPEAVEAAAREATLAARAAGAHVVAVEAVVPLHDGRVAVVMPRLRGGPLDALVRARGHLGPGELVTVLAPVAAVLGRLHAMGVVHGDVSPGNILLDLDGRPVLADLGLGQVLGEVSPGVWGTEGYVAPEVLLGADPSPATDVYALGAVGWLCLSGAVPGPPGLRPALHDVCRAGEGSAAVVEVVEAAVDADPTTRPEADTLAWALFQAAAPAPLDLVSGDDEASAVTYRLRAAAGRPAEPGPSRRVPRQRPRHARVRRRMPLGRAWGTWAQVRTTVADTRTRLRRRLVTAGRRRVLTAILAGVLLVGGIAALASPGRFATPGEAVARQPVQAAPADDTPRSSPVDADPRLDPAAPADRPAALLSTLAEARARAWREARPDLLDAAFAPGSPAAGRDREAVGDLASAGLRYTGLGYRVSDVSAAVTARDRATLRATVATDAYTVTGRGSASSRPANAGSSLLVDLVRTGAGWRVHDLRPAG